MAIMVRFRFGGWRVYLSIRFSPGPAGASTLAGSSNVRATGSDEKSRPG